MVSNKNRILHDKFLVTSYTLRLSSQDNGIVTGGSLVIRGKKIGPPSRRLTFYEKGVVVSEAAILQKTKKGELAHLINRINYQHKFEEVRLHSSEPMYGGDYTVSLEYRYKKPMITSDIQKLIDKKVTGSLRLYFPVIDGGEVQPKYDISISHD